MLRGSKNNPERQNGIVLLAIVIFIVLGALAYFVSGLSVVDIKYRQLESTTKSLQQAKQALIAYAASRVDITTPSVQAGRIGYLPCPANNNGEGNSVGVCNTTDEATLGWFPWRSLGLPPLRDESGTCLLYAVSGSYKFNPPTDMLNEDTYGMFQIVDESAVVVQGVNPEDRVVAIVFAPGKVLSGQTRNFTAGTQCGDDINNFSAYLDTFGAVDNSSLITGTADQIDQFIHATAESASDDAINPHNDRFITITRDDIWQAIMLRDEFDASLLTGSSKTRRVTEALARCLAQYGNDNDNSHLPYPAPVNIGGGDYRKSLSYSDAAALPGGQHFGRFPYITNDADIAIPGSITPAVLFDKNFSAPPNHSPPADIRACDNLPILFPAGVDADLRTNSAEDRVFWENRKDHFFYAVSNSYWPDSLPATDPLPDPTAAPARCGNCITVNAISYAAVVIYSGSKQPGQVRHAPVAPTDILDTKMFAANYIEVVNAAGNGMGDYTSTVTGNDVMFCITDTEPLDVVPCP